MPFHPNEARTDRLPVVQRVERAKQRKQRRRRRVVTVAVLATVLIIAVAARAWAWRSLASASRTCEGVTVTVTVPDEDWVEDDTTASGTVQVGDQSKPWSISGAGSQSVSFPLDDDAPAGTAAVFGTFNTGESAGGAASYGAAEGCEPTTTTNPPTTNPPTTSPPVTTPTPDKPQLGPPDQHRNPPVAPVPPQEAPPTVTETPGQLPFTGPEHPFGMNDLMWATFLVGLGLFAGAATLLWLSNRRQVLAADERRLVARATSRAAMSNGRPERQTAEQNLLQTLWGRRR